MTLLSAVTSMVLELTRRISGAMWEAKIVNNLLHTSAERVSSAAIQQGGIGLMLTTLIASVPPMAAMFFQKTLNGFSPYSVFGGGAAQSGRPGPQGQPAGSFGSTSYNPARVDAHGPDTVGTGAGGFSSRVTTPTRPLTDETKVQPK